jgi:hypothetical protein
MPHEITERYCAINNEGPCAKIDIVGVGEELIELLLIRSIQGQPPPSCQPVLRAITATSYRSAIHRTSRRAPV